MSAAPKTADRRPRTASRKIGRGTYVRAMAATRTRSRRVVPKDAIMLAVEDAIREERKTSDAVVWLPVLFRGQVEFVRLDHLAAAVGDM